MYITPGKTYKFTFVSGFEELDGVYTVLQVLSNAEMLSEQLSVEDTYTALGKEETEFIVDKPTYVNDPFLKLVHVVTGTEYYVSQLMIATVPDFSIKQYVNLGLLVPLGVFQTETELNGIESSVSTILKANHGITNQPIVIKHGADTWLTDMEYDNIVELRIANKETLISYYTISQQLSNENSTLRTRITQLETIIQSLL